MKKNLFSAIWLTLVAVMPIACARNSNPLMPSVNAGLSTPSTPAATAVPTSVPTSVATAPTAVPTVQIPDANLRAAIGQVLYANSIITSPSASFTAEDLATMTSLVVDDAGVTSLQGLQYCTGLTDLEVGWNNISNLSPISGLTGLNTLDVTSDPVTDLSAISGLVNLTSLSSVIPRSPASRPSRA
jgi:Leucine-rich repeat (LRR) protein